METPLNKKSSIDTIRNRFDKDVERFSQFETGQVATIDAPLAMELITRAAIVTTEPIQKVLDIGCGAGNNTMMLRQQLGRDFEVDLLDLSQPMLHRAKQRVAEINRGLIHTIQEDFRTAPLAGGSYDVILAAAVLHHLRDDADWETAFKKLFDLLKPGGSVWITDLVTQENSDVQKMMWSRYGEYLESIGGAEYRQRVMEYIDQEDSPRSVSYQMQLLLKVGFDQVEILHKNSCFAAFGAVKKR